MPIGLSKSPGNVGSLLLLVNILRIHGVEDMLIARIKYDQKSIFRHDRCCHKQTWIRVQKTAALTGKLPQLLPGLQINGMHCTCIREISDLTRSRQAWPHGCAGTPAQQYGREQEKTNNQKSLS